MLKPLKTNFLQYFLHCQHQTQLWYEPLTIFFIDHDFQAVQKWQHPNHMGNMAVAFVWSWNTNVTVISQYGDLEFNCLMTAAWLHTIPPIHASPVTCVHLYRKLLTWYSLANLHNKRSLLYVCVGAYEIQPFMDQYLLPQFVHFVGWVVLTTKYIQYENAYLFWGNKYIWWTDISYMKTGC